MGEKITVAAEEMGDLGQRGRGFTVSHGLPTAAAKGGWRRGVYTTWPVRADSAVEVGYTHTLCDVHTPSHTRLSSCPGVMDTCAVQRLPQAGKHRVTEDSAVVEL